MLDLNKEHLAIVQEILRNHVPELTVWAYGSRVNGSAQAASDLDLVLINVKTSQSLKNIKNAFLESNLPISVDVMDWMKMPASFQDEIKKNYVVIQEGSNKY